MTRTEKNRTWIRLLSATTLTATAALLLSLTVMAADPPKDVTFTKDVAPIFQKSCQSCHHPGTAAPMSF